MNMSKTASPASLVSSSPVSPKISSLAGLPTRWFFTLEKLNVVSCNLRNGIDADKELLYRQQSACFIHDLGTKLHLPHWVMNVAIVYMHRFYVFHSFKQFNKHDIAAAALFLAAKVEEMPRKLEHIVKVAYAMQHRGEPQLDTSSDKYMEEAQKIATYENVVLQTLGFDLNVEVANTIVVKRILTLNAPKALAFAAYHFTTDSLHLTTLCLRYRPSVVACACIFLACDWAKWKIEANQEGKPWYSYLDSDVTPEILRTLTDEIIDAFQRCPEKLRMKRHLASVKRDAFGVVIPSSVMVDRNNGASLADFHGAYVPPATTSVRRVPKEPAAGSSPSIGPSISISSALNSASSSSASSLNRNSGAKGNPPAPTGDSIAPPAVVASKSASVSRQPAKRVAAPFSFDSSPSKRPRLETTSKVDLKSYKERMKDRNKILEQPTNGRCGGGEIPTLRKSFIPDVSSMFDDSWLFDAGPKDEKRKTLLPLPEINSNSFLKLEDVDHPPVAGRGRIISRVSDGKSVLRPSSADHHRKQTDSDDGKRRMCSPPSVSVTTAESAGPQQFLVKVERGDGNNKDLPTKPSDALRANGGSSSLLSSSIQQPKLPETTIKPTAARDPAQPVRNGVVVKQEPGSRIPNGATMATSTTTAARKTRPYDATIPASATVTATRNGSNQAATNNANTSTVMPKVINNYDHHHVHVARAPPSAGFNRNGSIVRDYDHGNKIVTDYGHTSATTATTWYDDDQSADSSIPCYPPNNPDFARDDWLSNGSFLSFGGNGGSSSFDCTPRGVVAGENPSERNKPRNGQRHLLG